MPDNQQANHIWRPASSDEQPTTASRQPATGDQPSAADQRWRLVRWEASALRTALAVLVPLLAGQVFKQSGIGLMIGLGALYVTIADKEGANLRSLLITTASVAVTALVATLLGRHPFVEVALMFLVGFFGAMAAGLGPVASGVGLAVNVVFAVLLGLPGGARVGLEHLGEFVSGGLWCTALTLALWQVSSPGEHELSPLGSAWSAFRSDLRKLIRDFDLRSDLAQHALQLAIAASIAVALYRGFHLAHGTWLILTAIVIVKPDYLSTRQRALERIGGSLAGGAAAILLVALIHNVYVLDLALALLCLLAYSQLPYSYSLYVLFLTPFVVLLINLSAPGNWQAAVERIGNTLGGGALALLVAYLMRPREVRPQDADATPAKS